MPDHLKLPIYEGEFERKKKGGGRGPKGRENRKQFSDIQVFNLGEIKNKFDEDKNIVESILNLLVNSDSSSKNAKQVSLLKGNYSITISNSKLSKIDMNVYENGVLRKNLSSEYELKKSQVVNFNINIVSSKLDFKFIPYGDKGSTGTVTIRRSS